MRASPYCSCNHCPLPLPSPPSPTAVTLLKHARRPLTVAASISSDPSPQRRLSPDCSGARSGCFQKLLLRAVAGALSFSLLSSPFPSLAADPSPPPPDAEVCREEEAAVEELQPEVITNEGLVEEAWEVVDESFFAGAGSRPWSPEKWREKREYVLHNNIQTRSKAHDVIRKMLASLGDPYTRFISPEEVISSNGYLP